MLHRFALALFALSCLLASACERRDATGDDEAAPRAVAAAMRTDGVVVSVAAPGFDAASAEQLLALPLERALAPLEGVASVRTRVLEGGVRIRLVPTDAADLDALLTASREAVDSTRDALPDGAEMPMLLRDTGPASLVLVTVPGAGREEVEGRVVTELAAVPGTAALLVCAPPRAIAIELDPARLLALGLDAATVEDRLRDHVTAAPAGMVIGLRTAVADDLESLQEFALGDLRKLSDVAQIREYMTPPPCRVPDHPDTALLLALRPGADTELAALAERLGREGLHLELQPLAAPDGAGAVVSATPEALDALGGGRIALTPAQPTDDAFGLRTLAGPLATTTLAVTADDEAVLRAAAAVLAAAATEASLDPLVVGLDQIPELSVELDRDRAAALGVELPSIAATLRRTRSGGVEVGQLIDAHGHVRPVRVFVGPAPQPGDAPDPAALGATLVPGTGGAAVPLLEVASLTQSTSWSPRLRLEQRRVALLRFPSAEDEDALAERLADVLESSQLPADARARVVALPVGW